MNRTPIIRRFSTRYDWNEFFIIETGIDLPVLWYEVVGPN